MNTDVFISYASEDKVVADAMCAALEARGLRCWIAPRDITPGRVWSEAIVEAIALCEILVLPLSSHSNASVQVAREVERAVSRGLLILPVRIEDVMPVGSLEYYLSTAHWMDALPVPTEEHWQRLARTAQELLRETPDVETASGGSERASGGVFARSSLPAQLRGFNWGAFLRSGAWLGAHNIWLGLWLGLLVRAPYAGLLWIYLLGQGAVPTWLLATGFVMRLTLGLRGNSWAWRNRTWHDIAEFKATQHRWMRRGMVLWCLIAACWTIGVQTGWNKKAQNLARHQLKALHLEEYGAKLEALRRDVEQNLRGGAR